MSRSPPTAAVLAATITEPLTPGPHPGIVIIHGVRTGQRIDYASGRPPTQAWG